jgi:hypothetical protein
MNGVRMRREWAMPSPDTFSIPPIAELLDRVLAHRTAVVDPFARNSHRAQRTNDLNPATSAGSHVEALEFARGLAAEGFRADGVLWDPPYSLRQAQECYASVGTALPYERTIDGGFAETKDLLALLLRAGSPVVSFGWNSTGFGKGRRLVLEEVLLVSHGAPHNDTICTVERKMPRLEEFA